MNPLEQYKQTAREVLDDLWREAYNAGSYNARRKPENQIDFWANPVVQRKAAEALTTAAIRLVVGELYAAYQQSGGNPAFPNSYERGWRDELHGVFERRIAELEAMKGTTQ